MQPVRFTSDMDSELRQYLDDMRASILQDTKTSIMEMQASIMERIDGRIDASEERMKDFIRKADFELETKIVGEFWKWGRSSDVRTREAISAS
jgi:hypothetical protein